MTCRKARHLSASQRDIADAYAENNLRRTCGRQGHEVAFCTVDRTTRELGMNGVARGRRLRTTIPAKAGRAPVASSTATSAP
ncbi:hypothetical protein [Nocardia pseudovaccinii]|uniref:hypothetical protein n=1 Tax=Nocardia pseudovaccinii TaxID=189540 RepID=UPI0012F4A7B8|nr:hypothetical protein [Nocardia pseudovaccinii]